MNTSLTRRALGRPSLVLLTALLAACGADPGSYADDEETASNSYAMPKNTLEACLEQKIDDVKESCCGNFGSWGNYCASLAVESCIDSNGAQASGDCRDAIDSVRVCAGSPMCSEEMSSAYVEEFTGLLQPNLDQSLCVHKMRSDWQPGTDLHLRSCDEGAAAQKTWHFDAKTGRIQANSNPSMCWHKERLDWRNGQRIHLWDCGAGGDAQKTWILDATTGRIHARENPSMCASVWNTTQGEVLVLRGCTVANWNGTWELEEIASPGLPGTSRWPVVHGSQDSQDVAP